MSRLLRLTFATSLLLMAASAASAAVHVRVAIDPQTIPLCSRAHFSFELGNDGTLPIGVRVGIALLREGQPIAGPIPFMTRLAAGQRRTIGFNFFMPPLVPLGSYAFAARAQATDGTSSQSVAPFDVVQGTCATPGTGIQPTDELMRQILQGIAGGTPTATEQSPWGAVKQLYR